MKNRLVYNYGMKNFDYIEFSATFNAAKFAQCLNTLDDKEAAYSTINEKEAIDLFLKAHAEASSTI